MFILLGILVVIIAYILWLRRHIYRLSWQLPRPFAFPIIGNVFSVHPNNILNNFDRFSKEYGSPFRIWFGPILAVVISDAENMEIVTKSKDCLNRPLQFRKILQEALTVDGLFSLEADTWKVHRRLVGPTINYQTVGMHIPVFNDTIRKFVSGLPTNGEFFDILPFVMKCKITMFLEAAIGSDWDSDVKQRYLNQFVEGIGYVTQRCLQPLYHIDFIWNSTNAAKKLREYNEYGRRVFEKTILSKNQNNNDDNIDTFLGRLLAVSNKNSDFSIEDVLAETVAILIGASETSSTASAFVTIMLAMHPEYQEKVFDEIYKVMPDKSADLSQADLEKLTFTDLCVRETFRIFPTAPMIAREASKPIRLANNVEIPAGVPILLGIRQIHIQEKYYGPTAHIFNPYRFQDENLKNLPPTAYVPFSYSLRNCPGYHYAQASVKCFIAHLIRNFRITTTYKSLDELHMIEKLSMNLLGKHMVKLELRRI